MRRAERPSWGGAPGGAGEQESRARWESEGGAVGPDPGERCAAGPRAGRVWAALRVVKKLAVAVAGGSVLVAGVALIFLPGPAILVIPIGLAILATEFAWARRLLGSAKRAARALRRRVARGRAPVRASGIAPALPPTRA
jgi:uncharacterized protein (TIGR02611 family)